MDDAQQEYQYPFGTGFVIMSFLMIILAVSFLIPLFGYALLPCLVLTPLLTAVFFVLKLYFYCLRKRGDSEGEEGIPLMSEAQRIARAKRVRWGMIALLFLTFLFFLGTAALFQVVGPFLGLIIVSSFVLGLNLSEILIYLFCRSKS